MAPVVGYLIIKESHMTALALFAVSGITDWVRLTIILLNVLKFNNI